MAAKSKKTPASRNPKRDRLPFEPTTTQKKSSAAPPPEPSPAASTERVQIPAVVNRRMVQRMAVFCGVPTALGLLTFPLSYLVVSQDWFKLPVVAVLLTTLSFFGMGAVGLSYGALSASWDEDISGTKLGWPEFKLNFGRMREAWRAQRQQKNS